MNKLTTLLMSGLLVLGTAACNEVAKTNTEAPETPTANASAPTTETAKESQKDATSEVRRAQANSDIRAREQRNQVAGDPLTRANGDLESEIRSKLEVNLPASSLAVKANDGAVVISGVVPTPEQLARIEPLAKEIKGVKSVEVKATVKPAVPGENDGAAPGDSTDKDAGKTEEKSQ